MGCTSSKDVVGDDEIPLGAVKVRVLYDKSRKQLILRAKQGRGLQARDINGFSDPYVKAAIIDGSGEKHARKTSKTKNKTLNPIWDEEIRWDMSELESWEGSTLLITVKDYDTVSRDDFLGKLTFDLADVLAGITEYHNWYALLDKESTLKNPELGVNWVPSVYSVCRASELPIDGKCPDQSELNFFDEIDTTMASPSPSGQPDFGRQTTASSKIPGYSAMMKMLESKDHREQETIHNLARELGEQRRASGEKKRHVTVVYNPVSGNGTAKKIVDLMVAPVLRYANVEYDVVPTQYAGFATEYIFHLDLSKTDGLLIAGGDGLVSEVVTGYCRRADKGGGLPLGIIPSGTANAMAHELHTEDNHSQVSVVGRAALAAARGETRGVDVLQICAEDNEGQDVYALSVMGWGLAGAVALQAAKMRWIPGQKRVRYDFAGFVTLLGKWPVVNTADMSFLMEKKNADTGEMEWVWQDEGEIKLVNMLVTNLPHLGMNHAIYENLACDDGKFAVVMVNGNESRKTVINMALDMKKHRFMADSKGTSSFLVKEVKITPKPGQKTPFLVDGDAMDAGPVHIKCWHQGVQVFGAKPE